MGKGIGPADCASAPNARFNNKKTVVASLLGRVAAKLRGTDLGDLLIQTLRKGGAAARVAAIGGISMCETVVKATTTNMERLALQVNASNIVCLTEPRIVDALFDAAGGLLIPVQDENSPQCRRLIGRNVSFAMLEPERMASLKDGDPIEIDSRKTRIVSVK